MISSSSSSPPPPASSFFSNQNMFSVPSAPPLWDISMVTNPPPEWTVSNFVSNSSTQVLLTKTTETYRRVAVALAKQAVTPTESMPSLAVDIGSAFGNTAGALAATLNDPARVLGIDVGWKFVQASRQNYPDIRFERLDVLEDFEFVSQLVAEACQKNDEGKGQLWVFVDIGGVRELAALVRLLPQIVTVLKPSYLVVKSSRLCSCVFEHNNSGIPEVAIPPNAEVPFSPVVPTLLLVDSTAFWEHVLSVEAAEGIIGGSKERRGGAPVDRYPLKLPVRFNAEGAEICRFHNYSPSGCIRGSQGRCPLDHRTCHWCGEAGHVALACPLSLTTDQPQALFPDGRLKPPLAAPAPFLLCTGGRLRGKTLVNCERLNLADPAAAWEPAPALADHRGSHGAAVLGATAYVLGGGGMRANLASCEALGGGGGGGGAVEAVEAATRRWRPAPGLAAPRSAFATAVVGGAVYAIGGWTHGSTCLGGVERLDLLGGGAAAAGGEGAAAAAAARWVPCAPLGVPRRLHGAAGHPRDGRVYVFGGVAGAAAKTARAERYDPAADAWEGIADLPRPMIAAAVSAGAFLWLFPAGDDPALRYDPARDEYAPAGPLPLPAYHCFAAAWGGASDPLGVYLVGGTTRGKWTGRCFRAAVPPPTGGGGGVSRDGEEEEGPAVREEIMIPPLVWEELPSLAMPRRRAAVVVLEMN